MNNATDDLPLPAPDIRPRKGIPLVWVLPLITLLVGLWLLWQGVIDHGIRINIEFETGEGISAGQTELRYKGIAVGVVKELNVKPDLSGVIALVELDRKVKRKFIPDDSKFWLVKPQVSASGISGLSALMTGNFIEIEPGASDKVGRDFKALREAPALPESVPGLHLNLRSDRVGSLNPGTPVLYRQINIGTVQSYKMADNNQSVLIRIHILPEYSHLVRENSRFWNASGIQLNAGLGGVKLKTESLATIVAGGIALSPVDENAKPAQNGREYALYSDFEEAEVGLRITLRLPSGEGITPGVTKIMYKGMAAGRVRNVWFDKQRDQAVAELGLSPEMEGLINENTRLWLVRPSISLAGVSGLDALVNGSYISFEAHPGSKPQREFIAADGPSPANYEVPGLHLSLHARDTQGLQVGAQVYHRQIPVGSVENIKLAEASDKVEIQVLIHPEYAHLVSERTRFWNTSGIQVDATLGGLHLRTESLASMMAGGISFATDADNKGKPVENGAQFRLYRDADSARGVIRTTLTLPSAAGLVEGRTNVVYRGVNIGTLERVKLDANTDQVEALIFFTEEAEPLLVEGTEFWMVTPRISGANVSGLDALAGGPYLTLTPGKGAPKFNFSVRENPAPLPTSTPGLHLTLLGADGGSLSQGAPVLYKKLEVGSVQEVRHTADGKQVQVRIHIRPEYTRFVTRDSRFWNASGIALSGGLGNLKLRTESAGAVLAGGVAFDNPSTSSKAQAARSGDRFSLHDTAGDAEQAGITLHFTARDAADLRINAHIVYRGLQVGQVTQISLSQDLSRVEATATLRPEAEALARTDSRFWLALPRIGLARAENMGAVFTGPEIHVKPGAGKPQRQFALAEEAPPQQHAEQGLNLRLEAPMLGSLKAGDPVTYRQVRVGQVLGVGLSADATQAQAYINIAPEYAHLVRDGSRFWLTSGVRIKAGFSGIQMSTESAETILSGGVAFATPDKGKAAKQGQGFALAEEPKSEWLNWKPTLSRP